MTCHFSFYISTQAEACATPAAQVTQALACVCLTYLRLMLGMSRSAFWL